MGWEPRAPNTAYVRGRWIGGRGWEIWGWRCRTVSLTGLPQSSKKKKKKKNKVILPPQLPPEVDDGEVVVTRVADHDDEDEVERPYEEREGNRKVAEALSLRPCKEHDDLVEGGRRIPHQDAAGEAGLQQRQRSRCQTNYSKERTKKRWILGKDPMSNLLRKRRNSFLNKPLLMIHINVSACSVDSCIKLLALVPKQLPVDAELRGASFTLNRKVRRSIQKETLSALFETYLRILKHRMYTSNSRTSGARPLMYPQMEGLGKFSHLIDLDFMGELTACLKKLSGYTDHHSEILHDNTLSTSQHLQCCIIVFNVGRSNLEALNVDLEDFFLQLFNHILGVSA
uniref:Uncharacterized protein n=1 Tax=Oryza sativa subsp. japonica TaxID=39947 RepID=Q75GD2_ORYSJ|nr:hypothetical protein [Oryza sativa Japonica Group]